MKPKVYQAITAELRFDTALHIGSGDGGAATDALLRRNGRGELIIPGTALAGALRSLATRLSPYLNLGPGCYPCLALMSQSKDGEKSDGQAGICGCQVCHLFGEVHPGDADTEAEGGRASRLWVYNAKLISITPTFIRDGVGISRLSNAAANESRVKFDAEVLPAGTVFDLCLELEDATEEDKILLSAILAEWQAGRAWLGGARARGLGRASLENVNYWSNHLSNSGELLSYLRSKNPLDSAEKDVAWIKDHTAKARTNYHLDRAGRPFVEARFFLKFDGLFLTQDTALSGFLGFDYVSLLDGIPTPGRELIPILPGAGLRGSLRSQAEKIVRTLASHNALAHGDFAEKQFLITCPACDPTQENPEKPLTKCAEIDNLKGSKDEAEEKHLCLACRLFGSSRRGSRLSVMDASLHGDPVWKVMDFLAIDRFTGGGLESAKFDAVALWQPTFRAQLFLEDPEDWELGWLAYVLRDLVDRRITFGFGGGKGFGRATAEGMKFIFGFTKSSDWDFSLEEHELKEAAGFYRVAAFSGKEWSGAQRPVADWIEAFHQEVANFRRDPRALLPLRSDSYFGSVSELYPLKEADHA